MTTTYTSKLGFGKPASGQTSWGNVINNEVTAMVEEAIVGLATINSWTTNSHTLTTSNGSTSEARCAILKLTDTGTALTGAGTVIVPDNSKLYAVINETGQTITVKTNSGTGIAVPTARQLNVICDGTNVVEQGSYSAAAHAATVTSTGLVTANTLKVGSSGADPITEVADEDTMSSDSATKLATQQSIKAYVDTTGAIHRSERIYPWADTPDIGGQTSPYITIGEDTTTTVATFDLHGNSRTVFQELNLAITGTLARSGSFSNAPLADAAVRVQRKSTGATGTNIGTCAVADAQVGGSSSSWKSISVSGDQTSKIDSFSSISTLSNGTAAKRIQNATYDDGTDRTTIVYNNQSSGTGLFSSTGGNVYISSSSFNSVGTWVTATPIVPSNAASENLDETYSLARYLTLSGSSAVSTDVTDVLPTLKLVPDSGGAGDVEMRVQVHAGPYTNSGQYTFKVLQVDQTNITRPV